LLKRLAPAVVVGGLGRPDERPAERFAAARSHAEALAERFVSAVRERPRSAYEVVAAMVPDAAEYNRRQSLLSIGLCVFEHFAARGVVAATVGDDGVRRFRASR
jgi:hypothetical protein